MRLTKAKISKYRSIKDTEFFDVEELKTILVGPNEAGKTAVLRALQQINPPPDVQKFDALRDYPRSEYNDISTKRIDPSKITVVEGHFMLDDVDKAEIPAEFHRVTYKFGRKLDNTAWHSLDDAPALAKYSDIKSDLLRLVAHADSRAPQPAAGAAVPETWAAKLDSLTKGWAPDQLIDEETSKAVTFWLDKILPVIDESADAEVTRHARLVAAAGLAPKQADVLKKLNARLPVFVLFNNYFRVRPLIHLQHLADRIASKVLDDSHYDYGNQCLLKLLGFTAKELSALGRATEPGATDDIALKKYRDQLDQRQYQLDAASVRLTTEIRSVWQPDPSRSEADRLRVVADGQYLKVVVEDSLGVNIELDQRSEGFQWLVSFFIVFFAESEGKHKNAVLLLDEPGLNLHGLKQRDFRETISRLSIGNQTLFSTHSPFLVGPDELDLVRVVEMIDRAAGTKVHTKVLSKDPASLLPLQEALGYDLAQSLFTQKRNLVLEGLTDYWYIEAVSQLLREEKLADLNETVALIPAQTAGKVVYFATILHANKLKVAALLDSDSAGDQAAQQDVLVHSLGNKCILRTKDFYKGPVTKPEIEDLLRDTLISVAKSELHWDISTQSAKHPSQPLVDTFAKEVGDFSKYKLAKAFLRWSRTHRASDLSTSERTGWTLLIDAVNKALK